MRSSFRRKAAVLPRKRSKYDLKYLNVSFIEPTSREHCSLSTKQKTKKRDPKESI